jgi:hypothetical protein
MLRRILLSAEREMMEKIRGQKLAELARIVGGEDWGFDRKVAPMLPMNRFKYRVRNRKVKSASSYRPQQQRIVSHPERQERNRRLAELARWIKGN